MDTNDKQFQIAYNDLVGAFLRFINIVNPAPTPEAQVSLICNSLKSLLDTLGSNPCFLNVDPSVSEETKSMDADKDVVVSDQGSFVPEANISYSSMTIDTQATNLSDFVEKRYAQMPAFTEENKYRFIIKKLKKPDGAIDINDYPFIIEFTGDDGIFTLDPAVVPDRDSLNGYVKITGSGKTSRLIKAGRIVKVPGAWEVCSPLEIALV